MNTSIEVYNEDSDLFLEINFDFSAYFTPARINCAVEDSCPEEGDSSWEIQKVTEDGKEIELSSLSKSIQELIDTEVQEWVDENGLQEIEDDEDERRGEAQYDAQEDAADFYAERGY
jgi:hypothetical protein